MRLARIAALVLLAGSLGANVLLGRARRRPKASAAAAGEAAAPERAQPETAVHEAAPNLLAPPPAACGAEVSALEQDVAARSETLRGVLPPELLFERGQVNPAAERLMGPLVAAALAPVGFLARAHALDCRDVACRITFVAPASVGDEAVDQALGHHAGFQTWSRDFALAEPTPLVDAATTQPLVQRTIFFKLDGPRAVAAASGSGETRGGR